MDEHEFARRIRELRARVAALTSHSSNRAPNSSVSPEAQHELESALEDLHVADEELRQQNEELLATRQLLEAERQRYQDLFEFAPDSYLVTNREGVIQAANQAAADLLNTPPKALVGKPLIVFLDEEQRRQFWDQLARLDQLHDVLEWEVALRPRERPSVATLVKVGYDEPAPDRPAQLRWLIRDISARRRAEEQVRTLNVHLEQRVEQRTQELQTAGQSLEDALAREREARLSAEAAEKRLAFLAEASSRLASSLDYQTTLASVARLAVPYLGECCIVAIADADGGIRRLAAAHADPAQEARINKLDQHFPIDPADPEGIPRVIRTGQSAIYPQTSSGGESTSLDVLHRQGVRSVLVVPLRAGERILGALAFRSGTAERYSPQDLALAEDLARRAAAAIENARLYHELREADRCKDEFLAMLSHELRNPLAPIRNALAIQDKSGVDRSVQAQARQVINRQVEHLARLVDDLLDVSRITRGKIELRKRPIDLATVVSRAVEDTRPLAADHGHQLAVVLPPGPLRLLADPVRLEQVLVNLLTNAIKYTEQGGRIELRHDHAGDEVVIRVRDNGIGIAPDVLPHIFDLFTQAKQSLARSQGGLGIGLTLVRRLAELHGGSVRATSPGLGQGSEFEVRLPLVPGSSQARDTGIHKRPRLASGETGPRRVVVVDDNRDTADSMAMLLRLWGHDVAVAHDGFSALETIRTHRPAVVLLDIGLPGIDGYEVARRLRRDPNGKDLVLIAVTGYGQEEDRLHSAEAGFNCHLVKPVEIETVQELLAGTAEKGAT